MVRKLNAPDISSAAYDSGLFSTIRVL